MVARRVVCLLLGFGGVALAGRTTANSVADVLRPRAAFDLSCPPEQIQFHVLEEGAVTRSFGAVGCGRRVRYETQCSLAGTNCVVRTGVGP